MATELRIQSTGTINHGVNRRAAKVVRGESEDSDATARGDNNDLELDSQTVEDGTAGSPANLLQRVRLNLQYVIMRDRPLSTQT